MKDYLIQTASYTQRNKIIDDHFFINYNSQIRKNKVSIDCFGSSWCILFINNAEGLGLLIRSENKYLAIESDKIIFCPPFSLLETVVPSGIKIDFTTITSCWPLDNSYKNPMIIDQEKTCSLPKNRNQVMNLISEFKNGEELKQQIVVSAIAEKLKAIIENTYHLKNEKIYQIANELKTSREVLSRSFKKSYNLTPIEYRHKLRIFEALALMNLGFPITEISENIGYSDPKQFIYQFKKHFKLTPKKYSPFNKNRI